MEPHHVISSRISASEVDGLGQGASYDPLDDSGYAGAPGPPMASGE